MTPAAKVGLALTVPAAAGAYPLYNFLTTEMERWALPLIVLDASVGESYSGKFGEEYGRYMMDPKSEKNKKHWDSSFHKIESGKHTIKDLFNNTSTGNDKKRIEKDFGEDEASLSKICDDIYKKEKDKVDSTGGEGKYKEEEVWKHCSVFGKKPETVTVAKEEGEYNGAESSNKLGKEKKDKLVAIKDTSGFWEFQEVRFNKRDLSNFVGDSPFKKSRENRGEKKLVKDLCLEEYKKTSTAISSYKKDFWEFCSLSGKEES